ncbi:hypothetical protein EDB86DRAFT_3244937 [Lactarius hatsudake]|nr:hypothetical protein EDB86DRAFT_3244937 [Lactarius hatsudake]
MDRMAKVVTRCTEPSPCESEGGGDPAGLQMEGRATESEAFATATAGVNANGRRRERALTGKRTKRKRERERKRETRDERRCPSSARGRDEGGIGRRNEMERGVD